MAFGKLTQKQ